MAFAKVERLSQLRNCHLQLNGSAGLGILAQIAGGSAMASALCFSNFSWLAWVSLFPLLISIRTHKPLQAMLSGIAWAMSLVAIMLLFARSDQSVTLGAGLHAVSAISFYTWLGAVATRYFGFHPLVLGVGWMFIELSLSPLGWHERVIAEVYASSGWLSLISHSLGYIFVGFLVTFISASFVSAAIVVCTNVPSRNQPTYSSTTFKIFLQVVYVLIQILEIIDADPRAPPIHSSYDQDYLD